MGSSGGDGGAGAAAQQAFSNQQQLSQSAVNQVNGLVNDYNQYYKPTLAGESADYNSSIGGIGGLLGNNYSNLLGSGGNLAEQTGINVNQLGQNLTGYASNTGNTNLAQANPALSGFYQNEMQNGINPQFAQNAQNQLAQTAAQQGSDLRARAAPGQNVNAGLRDIQNSQLAQSANLAGNLAGQSQTFANQGAQGVAGTASGLDAQTLSMLQAALSGGSGVNQNALQNLISAITSGQSGLNSSSAFTGQGQGTLTSGIGVETGLANAAGTQGAQFANTAQQASQANSPGALLGGVAGLFSPIKI